ncbi:2,3-bisphosphoglycerate-independent phosphoglycerate mutase [Sulfuriroseicoccus oceanibius]|uniref:2,3-bisphosphoglycerate-independent phosphoglycerate mutase n=1 Tax=Sulfuriroseicoccus oceanibius TaxID=2707525 RepID=A0A6B3L576_9BACT|nr:2,3-bisphosphoglycerate-independent phosphoglycerate mutase [Sulfuriroseicoccus oceanibius]QQL44332.1 2,3-bisphosphoglycerate-independent phosphoglycerate mutase [Sulfuriroseicoccus oceanibius]
MSTKNSPVVLIIRDGWGIAPNGQAAAEAEGNTTLLANTPFHDHLYATYPMSKVSASGNDVGLPEGQMGNSEVGHLNLGAGRIVYQDLTRINKTIADGELADNEVLKNAFAKATGDSRLHLVGLVSDGGVHSHQDHLVALAAAAKDAGVNDIMVHAITDGRDTSPTGGAEYLRTVEEGLKTSGARIATVVGRYYAMDRDNRWERTKLGWDAIVDGVGTETQVLPSEAVAEVYKNEQKTDEFMPALVFEEANQRRVRDGDVVLFFNFRSDRARQLSQAFLVDGFDKFETNGVPKVHYVTMTEYDQTFDCDVAFPTIELTNVLGPVVSAAGKTQLRIAETEKYPHVTYFFNGGVEEPLAGEVHKVEPSPKVATYDLQPEMSAPAVTATVVKELENFDLVILNFANPDMVGHTGIVEAGIKAVETIDEGVRQVVERTLELGGKLIITADHGNCEKMINPDGSPHTAHTTNLVHCLYVAADHDQYTMKDGILADIAPTLLDLLGVDKPAEMTGHTLRAAK